MQLNKFYYIDTDEIPLRIFPVTKIWYLVKVQFLSFTCEDITLVMATSVSANRKRVLQHLAIGVYMINRILHARAWIRILSSSVQLDISRVSAWVYNEWVYNECQIIAILSLRSLGGSVSGRLSSYLNTVAWLATECFFYILFLRSLAITSEGRGRFWC